MCTTVGLSILNGICKGDLQGRYTYISDSGCSVNDYFLFSNDLLSLVYESCELKIEERIESDHLPLTARVEFPHDNNFLVDVSRNNDVIEKFVWSEENACIFQDALLKEETRMKLDMAMHLIETDVNGAVSMFNECIKECAECMKKHVHANRHRTLDEWFDQECTVYRRNVRRLLRNSRRSLKKEVQQEFLIARREYKSLLKRKRKQYNDTLLNKLVTSIRDQK
jgi:hypothetical protein